MLVRVCGVEITMMNSIGIAGSTTMESWMVDLLFAQPGQSEADKPTAASTAASAVSVASAAKSAVAPVTGQAIADLQAGGADAASDHRYTTVAQANALVASNNAMTSAQISAAFYNGKGLKEPGDATIVNTFSTSMQMERSIAQGEIDTADDPAAAAALGRDPDSLRASAARSNAVTDSMQKAFDNHTLVIQKMSDIPGLNFTEREVFGGPSQNSQPESGTWTGSYDQQAMSDLMTQLNKGGKHACSPFIGGVQLLMTWTDDDLKYDG